MKCNEGGEKRTQAAQNPFPVAGDLERRLETGKVPVLENMLQLMKTKWKSVLTSVTIVRVCDPWSISFRRTWPNGMIHGVDLGEENIVAKVASKVTDHVHPAHMFLLVFIYCTKLVNVQLTKRPESL